MKSPTGGFAIAVAIACAAPLSYPGTADAGCRDVAQRAAFEKAVRRTLACATQAVHSTTARDCTANTPPACAAAEFAQILDVVGGLPPQSVAWSSQSRCQKAIFRASMDFVTRRIHERTSGYRRMRRSLGAMRLPHQCTVDQADSQIGPLPRLGGSCSGLAAASAGYFSAERIERCLRPALERLVGSALDIAPVPPNIVIVVTDDQRADGLDLMPQVQDLARQGVSFANAFTSTPICAPARAGILTGQHATRHGVIANILSDGQGAPSNGALSLDDSSTLATWFQAAGYRTGHFGKYLNGYSHLSPSIPLGWDDWRVFVNEPNNFFAYSLNENGTVRQFGSAPIDYSTDVITARALEFMRANASRPFLLMLTPFAPHAPSTPAPRHAGVLTALPPWRPANWFASVAGKPNWVRFYAISNLAALEEYDAIIQKQRESLLSVDEAIAAIDERLERLGLTDNTIFVFMSDHGSMWGEHRWTGKQLPYEESVRIPMVLRYPLRLPADEVRDEFALNYDVAPTLADLAGVTATHTVDGRSLVDAIEGAGDWRSEFVVQHFTGGFVVPPWDMLRTERYKYVRHASDSDELYDLLLDPHELFNLAQQPQHAGLRASLAARLDEVLAN